MSKKLEQLSKRLQVKIKLAQVKAAREIAALIPELIRLRTRNAGEGVDGPLKALEPSTKKSRDRYKDNLHPDTSPNESNLTATGQLLDSIKGKNIGSKVIIEPSKGKRKGELYGGKSTLSNREVLKYVELNGRKFHELSKEEKEEIIKIVEQIIKDEISSVIK
jgi:hypothetical protein